MNKIKDFLWDVLFWLMDWFSIILLMILAVGVNIYLVFSKKKKKTLGEELATENKSETVETEKPDSVEETSSSNTEQIVERLDMFKDNKDAQSLYLAEMLGIKTTDEQWADALGIKLPNKEAAE